MIPVNQQFIKNTNMKRLYNLLFQERSLSRAELARRTGLSRTAVGALIDELTEKGFLLESGSADRDRNTQKAAPVGRRPLSLWLRANSRFVAVFGWDETGVRLRLADVSGPLVFQDQVFRSPEDSYVQLSRRMLEERILGASAPIRLSPEQLLGICFVLPAMIDPDRREIYSTTFSAQRDGGEAGLPDLLQSSFPDYPVAVLNDTACAAYAEKTFTDIREPDFAYIRFSRGIGAAVFFQNRLLGNACASHTQFGHFSLDPEGPVCACGNRGCLELMLSEDTLPVRLERTKIPSPLSSLPAVTYRELGAAALSGDEAACLVIREMAREFARALSGLICLVRPRLLVLGGRAGQLGPLFREEVLAALRETGFLRMNRDVRLRYGILDDSACYSGAMKYFFDMYYQFSSDMKGSFFLG